MEKDEPTSANVVGTSHHFATAAPTCYRHDEYQKAEAVHRPMRMPASSSSKAPDDRGSEYSC